MAKAAKLKKTDSTATIGFEAKLWLAADKLRNNIDAAEYKHVVLYDTSRNNQHCDLHADYCFACPILNDSDWFRKARRHALADQPLSHDEFIQPSHHAAHCIDGPSHRTAKVGSSK